MARDSSPFARRLKKALSQRSPGQAPDAAPGAQEPPAPEPGGPLHEAPPVDATAAPDEQPTGEFPAIEPAQPAPGPVPDAPVESAQGQAPLADDEQPTGDVPAIAPSWLDAPSTDPIAPASTSAVDQSGTPLPEATGSVDWAPPADDVFEPIAPAPAPTDTASPYLPDPPAPDAGSGVDVWASGPAHPEPQHAASSGADDAAAPAPAWEAEAAQAEEAQPPRPIWEPIDVASPPETPSTAASARLDAPDDATPAWADEAEAIGEPAGPVVPPPLTGYGDPTPGPATPALSDGPTLSPPVLPKRDPAPEASPETDAAQDAADAAPDAAAASAPATPVDDQADHEAALAALPDEREPEWTPTALHEALSLDEDEETPPATVPSVSDGSGPTAGPDDTAETDADAEAVEQPAPVTPAPTAKRGLRSAFGRRKSADAQPVPDPTPDAAAETVATPTPEPEPETSIQAVVPTPTDVPTPAEGPTSADASPPADAGSAPASGDASTQAPDVPTPVADPGGITSRFAAIGRRALSRKEAKAAAAAAAAQAAADAAAHEAPLPGATPEPDAEVAPVAADAPPPFDYKPTFAERAALRRRVKSLRARRDAGLAELGAIVLDQSRFGDPTGGTLVRRRTALLADLDSEIAAIEAALDESGPPEAVAQLGVVHCTSCSALVGPADRFCASCGAARPSADAGAARDAA